ncbi:hypothetical protein ACFY7C_17600 [Streptomyces sp. NPDC012769]|uniref:hypothetical protein n=1 Tax=Streptomyces sp. NPDC012769 TaxID=3364848 RepID=UPI00368AC678
MTYAPTRRWLATRGLPARHRLMTFGPLGEARVRTVRQYLPDQGADADALAEDIAPLLRSLLATTTATGPRSSTSRPAES